MKIRNGFVSNSSSSSFVIRGLKISVVELVKQLNISEIELSEIEDNYNFVELFEKKLTGLTVENPNCYDYDDNEEITELIVGERLRSLNEGSATEFKDRTVEEDEKLRIKFEKFGIIGTFNTYIQYSSEN